ncbi:MAG: DNA repair protein RecN [Rhodobacteraceae bacterium]|nr:MAG: DNA repair protein RecN [Paracoccaceae bacterium]
MLSLLTIKNILLIDEVELEFKRGLNTLTGETGVGKSVLLDCLGFVLGWNNRSQLLRDEAKIGEVVAEFHVTPNSEVHSVLREAGINSEAAIIIRRSINKSEGRKRNFINDKSVSLDLIRRVSSILVELQDQTGNQILRQEQSHLSILDKFAGLGASISEIRKLWRKKFSIKAELDQEISQYESIKVQKDYLEFSIQEITDFNIQVDEEQKLDSKRKQLKAIEKNKEKFDEINKLLSSGELESNITRAIKLLDIIRQSVGDIVDKPISYLDQTLQDFDLARSETAILLDSQNFDNYELETIEERLFKLRALGRKYNVKTSELFGLMDGMASQLTDLNSSQNKITHLKQKLSRIDDSYNKMAGKLSVLRSKAAKQLDYIVVEELKYLKMPDCVFKTEILPVKIGSRGVDSVVFKVITNRGGEFGKLQAISSGGEMSRFLLALKVCLTDKEQGTTMIFDEIDKGIGGATADAVGRRLGMLAEHSQIIVVTHSPQVAAHGDHQWKVEKLVGNDQFPITNITELTPEERLTELARMLAGKEISSEALAAAKKLLG